MKSEADFINDLVSRFSTEVTLAMTEMRAAGVEYPVANQIVRKAIAHIGAIAIASTAATDRCDRTQLLADFEARLRALLNLLPGRLVPRSAGGR